MPLIRVYSLAVVIGVCIAFTAGNAQPANTPLSNTLRLQIPVEAHRLANGLRVVLSRDTTVPLVRIGVYYGVGPREEPRGRGGFAHLFEHLMFEGSSQLGPGEYFKLVTANGGRFGARTLYDFTKYNTTVPSNALELMLWAEADRMRGLRVDQSRLDAVRATVKNEVRQQSFNRPYGRFVWIDIPEFAQTRWENSHSIYGETPDGSMADLDSATVEDANIFFRAYYTPGNAVLVINGDFDAAQAMSWVNKYFGSIPAGSLATRRDRTEPRQQAEKNFARTDANASRPAVAIAYHLPARSDPAFWTMYVIDQILIEGRDSWMYQSLVNRKGMTDAVYGGLSASHGSAYTINGPNFWTAYVLHDRAQSPDSILHAMDVEIERIRSVPVDQGTLSRAITKARADFYSELNAGRGEGKVDMLGQLALFGDDPHRINRLEDEFLGVTPAMILATAREYLRSTNRTVLKLSAGGAR